MQALPHSTPLTLQQATISPHLHWRLMDTHRQVWVSLLWGFCSFFLGPGGHNRFPNLGICLRDWESPGNLNLEASGIWLQNVHRTGKTDSWRHKQNLVCTRNQEKGAVFPQETEPDLPVSVQESPAEAWVDSGLLRGQGNWIQQCTVLDLQDNLTPVDGAFPGHLPLTVPFLPKHLSFAFSWRRYLRWRLGPFGGVIQFFWVSPSRHTCY